MHIRLNDANRTLCNPSNWASIWLSEWLKDSGPRYYIKANNVELVYFTAESRNRDMAHIESILTQKQGVRMLEDLKGFYKKHQETVFTIGFVLLLDYFMFNGAFRQKLIEVINKILAGIEKKHTVDTTGVADGQ